MGLDTEKKGKNSNQDKKLFKESLVISDDQAWTWSIVSHVLERENHPHIRLPSGISIRKSWNRFKNAKRIIILWENVERNGGAIIEEILDVEPHFNVSERIIIIKTSSNHEDMVYSNELDIKRIVQIRQRVREIKRASREIKTHLTSSAFKSKVEIAWQKVERAINVIEQTTDPQKIERIDQALENLRAKVDKKPTPQYYDAKASLEFHRGNNAIAERFWKQAIELNPNFYKTYNKLISFYNATHQDERALDLIRKMQTLNKNNISRIVKMGEIYNKLKKEDKAEHCFKSALTRDKFCSQALNGLAEIKFRQGNLDESRNLLAQSRLAYKMATTLNQQGIELVNEGSYEDALKHYSKAQFVLPQQDKGPMLFYNIGLCYSKWGKPEIAQQFLKIALIKAPEYAKAKKLLSQL